MHFFVIRKMTTKTPDLKNLLNSSSHPNQTAQLCQHLLTAFNGKRNATNVNLADGSTNGINQNVVYIFNLILSVLAGEPPTFVPSIGEITVALNKTIVRGRTRDYPFYEVTFRCGFGNSDENDLLYRVTWYQNDCEMFVTDYGENELDKALELTESQFVAHGFTLGNTVGK